MVLQNFKKPTWVIEFSSFAPITKTFYNPVRLLRALIIYLWLALLYSKKFRYNRRSVHTLTNAFVNIGVYYGLFLNFTTYVLYSFIIY
jgi:hypothetical protein